MTPQIDPAEYARVRKQCTIGRGSRVDQTINPGHEPEPTTEVCGQPAQSTAAGLQWILVCDAHREGWQNTPGLAPPEFTPLEPPIIEEDPTWMS